MGGVVEEREGGVRLGANRNLWPLSACFPVPPNVLYLESPGGVWER